MQSQKAGLTEALPSCEEHGYRKMSYSPCRQEVFFVTYHNILEGNIFSYGLMVGTIMESKYEVISQGRYSSIIEKAVLTTMVL